MNTNARPLLMFTAFFDTMTNLTLDFFLQDGISLSSTVPNLSSAISWSSAYGYALTVLGTGYGGFFASFLNWLSATLAYPLGAFAWLAHMLGWVASMIGWVFSFISPPFYLAFGETTGAILSALLWIIIGISLLFSVKGPTGVGLQ